MIIIKRNKLLLIRSLRPVIIRNWFKTKEITTWEMLSLWVRINFFQALILQTIKSTKKNVKGLSHLYMKNKWMIFWIKIHKILKALYQIKIRKYLIVLILGLKKNYVAQKVIKAKFHIKKISKAKSKNRLMKQLLFTK